MFSVFFSRFGLLLRLNNMTRDRKEQVLVPKAEVHIFKEYFSYIYKSLMKVSAVFDGLKKFLKSQGTDIKTLL